MSACGDAGTDEPLIEITHNQAFPGAYLRYAADIAQRIQGVAIAPSDSFRIRVAVAFYSYGGPVAGHQWSAHPFPEVDRLFRQGRVVHLEETLFIPDEPWIEVVAADSGPADTIGVVVVSELILTDGTSAHDSLVSAYYTLGDDDPSNPNPSAQECVPPHAIRPCSLGTTMGQSLFDPRP